MSQRETNTNSRLDLEINITRAKVLICYENSDSKTGRKADIIFLELGAYIFFQFLANL